VTAERSGFGLPPGQPLRPGAAVRQPRPPRTLTSARALPGGWRSREPGPALKGKLTPDEAGAYHLFTVSWVRIGLPRLVALATVGAEH
jgi:hypothetical protein